MTIDTKMKMAGAAGLEPKQGDFHNFAMMCFCLVKIGDFSFGGFLAKVSIAKKNELK
jgi:hypothetical protein